MSVQISDKQTKIYREKRFFKKKRWTKIEKESKRWATFNQISGHTKDEFNFNYKGKMVLG